MTRIYLFDWGDTLMVDFPYYQGPMCQWPDVQVVQGALEALQHLSLNASIYIATNAEDSSLEEIKQAFTRGGLAPFITGYFSKVNVGIAKGTPDYFQRIAAQLDVQPHEITMVGDTLEKDIKPAIAAGLQAVWYQPFGENDDEQYHKISSLEELY
ncbi:HAD family hydrolase [Photobacterium satsumensis]|uniref:HAD family hydrolase n=1 Tax=Photobacterium satsumensis TaxID=2910239 RepID=UPI003D0FE4C3